MNIQWFPGHMAKTRRMIADSIKLVDLVIELVDARLPLASRNPEIDSLTGGKPRLVVLNKADLADEAVTKQWLDWFRAIGVEAMAVDSIHTKDVKSVVARAKQMLSDKIDRQRDRGMTGRSIKLMVVGIPNVGKSSFINKLAGRSSAVTGDRPGVTRGKQWIRTGEGVELLDTPGILWPKFESEEVGRKLAFVGSIKDDILDVEELACYLLDFLREAYPQLLCARYKLTDIQEAEPYELLEQLGRRRGFVISGGEIDTLRAANILLDEFRGCKLGRISLERPV